MQAVVKTHHIEINVKGEIPISFLQYLKKNFGEDLVISKNEEELVNVRNTDWYKKIKSKMTPAKYMKHLRESRNMTQEKLGALLGDVSRQNISSMDSGKRAISKDKAIKLSKLFKMPVERFLKM